MSTKNAFIIALQLLEINKSFLFAFIALKLTLKIMYDLLTQHNIARLIRT